MIPDLPLLTIATEIQNRTLSPLEVTHAVLDRITTVEPTINAFLTTVPEQAIETAKQAEQDITAGHYRGPLHGIPLSVKDLFDTAGIRTTVGSRILADNIPDTDSTVVQRLREAGAIIVGKTHMLEFAYTAIHPDYEPTRNSWNPDHSPGGSSSGSGAAVAAGMGYGSMGSDTGGSIRIPASYCGIVGLKPTYGLVSRHGVFPASWSADHVGPMTRTVADCAAMLAIIAGEDPRDPVSARVPVPDYLAQLTGDIAGKRIGIIDAYLREAMDLDVRTSFETALALLASLGAVIEEIPFPSPAEAGTALLSITPAEVTVEHLSWLRERPDDYGPTVRTWLELGTLVPAVSYIQAQRIRRRITDEMLLAMKHVDAVALPTLPAPAPPIGGDPLASEGSDSKLMALLRFIGPFNLTGFPAISIPSGFSSAGLPIGLQLVARPFREASLLNLAFAYEQSTTWHLRRPA